MTKRNTASALDITEGSSLSIVHDVLILHRFYAQWVLRLLAEEHKDSHMGISSCMLEWYCSEGEIFCNYVLTCAIMEHIPLWSTAEYTVEALSSPVTKHAS